MMVVMGTHQKNVTLIRERLDRGLTVEQAAEQMGVGADTLHRAEQGRHRPRPENGFRIAKFYDLKYTEVWPIVGEDINPDPSKGAA